MGASDRLSGLGELKLEDSSTVDGAVLLVHKKEKLSSVQTCITLCLLVVGAV